MTRNTGIVAFKLNNNCSMGICMPFCDRKLNIGRKKPLSFCKYRKGGGLCQVMVLCCFTSAVLQGEYTLQQLLQQGKITATIFQIKCVKAKVGITVTPMGPGSFL